MTNECRQGLFDDDFVCEEYNSATFEHIQVLITSPINAIILLRFENIYVSMPIHILTWRKNDLESLCGEFVWLRRQRISD